MKKTFKSTLSLLLALVMIFSLGISAFAADEKDAFISADTLTIAATINNGTSGASYETQTISVLKGDTITLTPNKASTYKWKTSNTSAVRFNTADNTNENLETDAAVKLVCVANGQAKITIDNQPAYVIINVENKQISSVSIKHNSNDVTGKTVYGKIGEVLEFEAKANYANDAKASAEGVSTEWNQPTTVFSCSRDGAKLQVTLSEKNTSGTTFTATHTDTNAYPTTATANVTVKTTTVDKITIAASENEKGDSSKLNSGDTYKLTATITDVDKKETSSTDSIVWKAYTKEYVGDGTDKESKLVTFSGSGKNIAVNAVAGGTAYVYAIADGVMSTPKSITISDSGFTTSTTVGTNYYFASICNTLLSSQDGLTNSSEITFFNISDTYGSLYLADGTKVTTSLFASSTTKKISDFKGMYMTPSKSGTYELTYQTDKMDGKGTIKIVITNKAVSAKATVVANSAAFKMSDTNTYTTTSVQAQLEAAVANFSYVVFDDTTITGSTYGKLSAVSGTSYYKTKSALSSNALLSSVTFTPNSAAGDYTIGFKAYDSNGSEYPGTLTITVSPAEYVFQFGAEGYTFKASDFIKSTDSDPIKTVSFTLPTSGVLYTNYSYGKGTAVAKANSFTSSTLGTLTYIPSANYPIDVSISFTATTNAGKTISGVAKMDYIDRTATLKFTDVTASWAIPAVDFCSTWGIATGTGTGTFNPNGTMQRGMLVTMLYRVAGQPNVSGYANPFKDVYVSDYYFNAVVWAYNMGIVKGTTTTTFSPNNAVSRQDIAVMLARFEGVKTYNVNYIGNYKDASNVASYATVAMNWAVGNGIISGNNGYLTPTATGTRAQVAAMLHRYLAK